MLRVLREFLSAMDVSHDGRRVLAYPGQAPHAARCCTRSHLNETSVDDGTGPGGMEVSQLLALKGDDRSALPTARRHPYDLDLVEAFIGRDGWGCETTCRFPSLTVLTSGRQTRTHYPIVNGTGGRRRSAGSARAGTSFLISEAVLASSMQHSHMPAFRSALSVSCIVAGLVLLLRALGLLEAIPHFISHWWSALPGIVGAAILARSFRPGPHIVVAGGLMLASCVAFAADHGFITERTWSFAGAGGLIIAGIMLTWSSMKVRSVPPSGKSAVRRVLFRVETLTPSSSEVEHLKVFLLCGNMELDLRNTITPSAPRNVFTIDITACLGRVNIVVLPGTEIFNHKAFVIRLTKRIQAEAFNENYMREADVIAATLAFFGDVDFEVRTSDDLLVPASNVPGALPARGGHAPANQ